MSDPTPNLPTTATSSAARTQAAASRWHRDRVRPRLPAESAREHGVRLAGVGCSMPLVYCWLSSRVDRFFRAVPSVSRRAIRRFGPLDCSSPLTRVVGIGGVWAAGPRCRQYPGKKDPQYRGDRRSVPGQLITYLAHCARLSPNWKYLLLGFILFRVFDIWKPFPARQAESLPGGLGIMADDWIAGIYAALGLWIARRSDL